jgi:hypothetical protein
MRYLPGDLVSHAALLSGCGPWAAYLEGGQRDGPGRLPAPTGRWLDLFSAKDENSQKVILTDGVLTETRIGT